MLAWLLLDAYLSISLGACKFSRRDHSFTEFLEILSVSVILEIRIGLLALITWNQDGRWEKSFLPYFWTGCSIPAIFELQRSFPWQAPRKCLFEIVGYIVRIFSKASVAITEHRRQQVKRERQLVWLAVLRNVKCQYLMSTEETKKQGLKRCMFTKMTLFFSEHKLLLTRKGFLCLGHQKWTLYVRSRRLQFHMIGHVHLLKKCVNN